MSAEASTWPADTVHRLSRVEQMVYLSRAKSTIDAVDYARDCIELAESASEKRRRALTARRRAILEDNWQSIVYADLKKRIHSTLHPYVLGDNGRYCDISRNPAKNIWQECAVLYKSAAQRETPEKPADAELYRRLVRGTKFQTFWAQVEVELYFFNDLILWPTTVKRRGRKVLQHNKAAGDTVTAIFDPELGGTEPFAIIFHDHYQKGDGLGVRYIWWTPQWRAVFDDSDDKVRLDPVTLLPLDDSAPLDNPYRQMPFTYLHLNPYHNTFWNQTQGDDLVELTIKTGRQQTQTNDLFNRCNHKQAITTGENIRKVEDKTLLDPGAHMKIYSDGSTQLVDWAPDFEGRQNVIDRDEARAAGSYGINPERLRKTSYQTAEGARLTERPLEEKRHKMREPLADAERDYRESVIRVADVERIADEETLPDPEVWMEVIHAPIAYPGDPKAQLEVDEMEIGIGLTNAIEIMQRRYPGISKKEAERRIQQNIKMQAKVQKLKQANSVPAKASNRSAEDEENGRQGPVVRDGDNGQSGPGSLPGQQPALDGGTDDNAE